MVLVLPGPGTPGDLVGELEAAAVTNFGRLGGWLDGRVSEKQPSEVRALPPLGAKASRSKIQKWLLLKQQIFKIQALVNQQVNFCQIKTEIICVQHAPKGTCTAKRSEAAPFA